MALSLLGTGSAVKTTYSNTLTANSANCQYHDGSIQNGKKIVNYVPDDGYKKCKSCGQITGKIDCLNHSWQTEYGEWFKRQKHLGKTACPKHIIHIVNVYYEERIVTKRCTICGVKKVKKQERHGFYKGEKLHYTINFF